MKREPQLRAWQNVAPPGGWLLPYQVPERPQDRLTIDPAKDPAVAANPKLIVETFIKWRVDNGLPANEDEVWAFCNAEWCRRDPQRCMMQTEEQKAAVEAAERVRRVLRPTDWGPWIWQYLNTFGVHFDKALFEAAITQARAILNPSLKEKNHFSGCALCSEHFADVLRSFPIERVTTREECAVWVWNAHNLASGHANNPRQPFLKIARRFGWTILEDNEVNEILSRLAR